MINLGQHWQTLQTYTIIVHFLVNTYYFVGGRLFCRKKTPGGRAGGLAPGVRVHHFTIFLKNFWHFLKLFGIIWDASRGSLEVVRSNFRRKCFRDFCCSGKCLGGSRMVLGVPRTTLKNITFPGFLTFV